jgi:hypothetical protein
MAELRGRLEFLSSLLVELNTDVSTMTDLFRRGEVLQEGRTNEKEEKRIGQARVGDVGYGERRR